MPEYLDAEELNLIVGDLTDRDLEVRQAAMMRLERLLNTAAEEARERPLQGDADELDLWWKAKVGLLNRPEVVNAFILAMEDSSPRIRGLAAINFGSIEDIRAEQALTDHLRRDDHPQVRMMCMSALRGRMSARLFDIVVEALQDPYAWVSHTACMALGETGDPRAVEPLRGMLSHPDWDVRHRACQALVRLGAADARVVAELERLAAQPQAADHDDIMQKGAEFSEKIRGKAGRRLTVRELAEKARAMLDAGSSGQVGEA